VYVYSSISGKIIRKTHKDPINNFKMVCEFLNQERYQFKINYSFTIHQLNNSTKQTIRHQILLISQIIKNAY
jgi:hypothetical protein